MDDLLPLPEPAFRMRYSYADGPPEVFYNEHQMRAYAAACVAAERKRCAKLCLEKPGYFGSFANAELFAALIRGK